MGVFPSGASPPSLAPVRREGTLKPACRDGEAEPGDPLTVPICGMLQLKFMHTEVGSKDLFRDSDGLQVWGST